MLRNSSQVFEQVLEEPQRLLLTVSLHSWEYLSVQFWVLVRGNPRWKQCTYIYVGILQQASNLRSSKSSRSFQGTKTRFFHQPTWFLEHFSGYKSVREQPALKDEMPLWRKGKENKRLLVQPKGTHHCHHRRSTSKPSKAAARVMLGGRRWGTACRAQVSSCYLRAVPEGSDFNPAGARRVLGWRGSGGAHPPTIPQRRRRAGQPPPLRIAGGSRYEPGSRQVRAGHSR